MRETNIASIEAYRKEIEPHLSEKQLQVLQVFDLYKTEKCCHEIALHLKNLSMKFQVESQNYQLVN